MDNRIFSDRHRDQIEIGNGISIDHLCGDVEFGVKETIAQIMCEFTQPVIRHPDRHIQNISENSDALELATEEFNRAKKGSAFLMFNEPGIEDLIPDTDRASVLANTFTPFLFDVLEIQCTFLPESKKTDLQAEINKVLEENGISWRLRDGLVIDPEPLEMGLKLKISENLSDFCKKESAFQSVSDELTHAEDLLLNGEYEDAITNAGKSYESALKIMCQNEVGTANELTDVLLESRVITIPDMKKNGGFRQNVLLSLPFIRNNWGAHGKGTNNLKVDRPLANLAVNLACALDTYLIDEYRKNNNLADPE